MKKWAYYNEIDAFAASWLHELINEGLIPDGEVDERDIRDVRPADVLGFSQCHWFAGIGRLARGLASRWPCRRPGIWTGSCPCQPFSAAGRRGGFADKRHLWPSFFHLIEQCRPALVVGEQVSGAAGLRWLDLVCDDLEGCGYTVRAEARPACSVGAPHKRERLWWLAYSRTERHEQVFRGVGSAYQGARSVGYRQSEYSGAIVMADGIGPATGRARRTIEAAERGGAAGDGPWDAVEWLPCRDGRARPALASIQPLASGVPNRVDTLRGAGNAIVPQLGAAFLADNAPAPLAFLTGGRDVG